MLDSSTVRNTWGMGEARLVCPWLCEIQAHVLGYPGTCRRSSLRENRLAFMFVTPFFVIFRHIYIIIIFLSCPQNDTLGFFQSWSLNVDISHEQNYKWISQDVFWYQMASPWKCVLRPLSWKFVFRIYPREILMKVEPRLRQVVPLLRENIHLATGNSVRTSRLCPVFISSLCGACLWVTRFDSSPKNSA